MHRDYLFFANTIPILYMITWFTFKILRMR